MQPERKQQEKGRDAFTPSESRMAIARNGARWGAYGWGGGFSLGHPLPWTSSTFIGFIRAEQTALPAHEMELVGVHKGGVAVSPLDHPLPCTSSTFMGFTRIERTELRAHGCR